MLTRFLKINTKYEPKGQEWCLNKSNNNNTGIKLNQEMEKCADVLHGYAYSVCVRNAPLTHSESNKNCCVNQTANDENECTTPLHAAIFSHRISQPHANIHHSRCPLSFLYIIYWFFTCSCCGFLAGEKCLVNGAKTFWQTAQHLWQWSHIIQYPYNACTSSISHSYFMPNSLNDGLLRVAVYHTSLYCSQTTAEKECKHFHFHIFSPSGESGDSISHSSLHSFLSNRKTPSRAARMFQMAKGHFCCNS